VSLEELSRRIDQAVASAKLIRYESGETAHTAVLLIEASTPAALDTMIAELRGDLPGLTASVFTADANW
jgi:hypothetical protein